MLTLAAVGGIPSAGVLSSTFELIDRGQFFSGLTFSKRGDLGGKICGRLI
jgi:hypothetical protein